MYSKRLLNKVSRSGSGRREREGKKKAGAEEEVEGGEVGVKGSQDSERKQATAASFCSRFNGTERSCLLPLARVVPHHSTYKSGLVIKLYHQAPPTPHLPFFSLFYSLHFFFQPASPAICSLPPFLRPVR